MAKYIKISDMKRILGTIINETMKKGQVILDKPNNTITLSDKRDLIEYNSKVKALGFVYIEILSDEEFLSRVGIGTVDIPDEKPDLPTKPENRFAVIDIVMESETKKKKKQVNL
jgi:hypothetical protein